METRKNSYELQAYEKIKEAIYKRRLAPGAPLVEQSLCDAFHVSRTPVRNALRRLSQEGYVEIIPNKGAFVIQPSIEDIRQLYEVRIELEIFAVHLCIETFREDDIKILQEILDQEQKAFEDRDFPLYMETNTEFHATIVDKAENQYLSDIFHSIYKKMNIILTLYDNFYVPIAQDIQSVKYHELMILAIENKQVGKFEKLLKELCDTIYHAFRQRLVTYSDVQTAVIDMNDAPNSRDVRFTL